MKKILLVDDDPNILAALQRQLRKEYAIEIALGPLQGLAALARPDEHAVVVADMNMPHMNGVEFLTQVRIQAPNAVRLMLTGNADQQTAAEAVNQGNVFRFLTKPCTAEQLAFALEAALHQHHLIVAEQELLEKTLHGSIKVLTEMLAMVDPQSFGRTQTLKECVQRMVKAMSIGKTWQLEAAAMLSHIGYVTVPPEVLGKVRLGQKLAPEEQELINRVPEIGCGLLANIPRMEGVAQIVLYQNKRFDGFGFPRDTRAGDQLPLGARLLKVLSDLVELEAKGVSRIVALENLRDRQGWYDPKVLDAAYGCFAPDARMPDLETGSSVAISLAELRVGQALRSDVETRDGALIASKGQIITQPLLERLRNVARLSGIKEPVYVEQAGERPPGGPGPEKPLEVQDRAA
jgi:response regulator RpfG family c-di-GMP phosphodiesterase